MTDKFIKKDNFYYMDRLFKRFQEEGKDYDACDDWEYLEEISDKAKIMVIMQNFDEARALVDTLEASFLDNDYRTDKMYPYFHTATWPERNQKRREGCNPDKLYPSEGTRSQIIERLEAISSENFGENVDEWRSWYDAWNEPGAFFIVMRG